MKVENKIAKYILLSRSPNKLRFFERNIAVVAAHGSSDGGARMAAAHGDDRTNFPTKLVTNY